MYYFVLFSGFHKYLKYHKLHKYLYFFANLSYHEILSITSTNIQGFEDKVDLFPMTTGARNAILRKLTDLNLRQSRLLEFNKVILSRSVPISKTDEVMVVCNLLHDLFPVSSAAKSTVFERSRDSFDNIPCICRDDTIPKFLSERIVINCKRA